MDNPRPTGDDAEFFSHHTQDLPEIGRLTREEAAELLENCSGRLVDYGSTAAAITALSQRLARLNVEKEEMLNLLADKAAGNPEVIAHLHELHDLLRSTLELLALYRAQQQQSN